VTIDGKPFTPMFYGQTSGDWLRDWIFVLLGHNWYDRELNWKLNQSGELMDMKKAPFAEPLVSADTKDADALAARQRLQTVLDQLNPAAGKVDPKTLKKNGNKKKGKKQSVQEIENASQNANAPNE